MGYTHYWRMNRSEAKEADILAAIEDCHKIVMHLQYLVAGPVGTGTAVLETTHVAFNGRGPNAHETLELPPNPSALATKFYGKGWSADFCKTARKPYDVVVVACLAAFKDRLGSAFEVTTDGGLGDMEEGAAVAELALGRSVANPLEPYEDLSPHGD